MLRISSDRDNRRIFWVLKFSFPGFFWFGKFGKDFFGWLDLIKDFFGVIKTILWFAVVLAYDNFRWYGEEINSNIQFRMFFLVQWLSWVLLEALGNFLGFEFCPHSIIPVTWNPPGPSPAATQILSCLGTCFVMKGLNDFRYYNWSSFGVWMNTPWWTEF